VQFISLFMLYTMCFNANVSLSTFLLGSVFSIILIHQKTPKYIAENTTIGIFFIFISLIQLMDFFFWIDLKNTIGLNKLTTIIGPLLNMGQPIILYLIKYFYYKPTLMTLKNNNLGVATLNILYAILLGYKYITFLKNDNLVTGTKNGHLSWPWMKYSMPLFYLILFAINIFYLSDFKYASFVFLITYFFLILSRIYFKYNTGELWCFFGAFIPAIMVFFNWMEQ